MLGHIDEMVDKYCSDELWRVVETYAHRLFSRYPRPRYIIGNDAFFVLNVLARLPEWLQDYLLNKSVGAIPDKCLENPER